MKQTVSAAVKRHQTIPRPAASTNSGASTMNGPGTLATVSTTTTVMFQKMEDDWESQLRDFEEIERWEKIGKQKLPANIRQPFLNYLSNYSGGIRMPAYKMMDTLLWNSDRISELYAVLAKLPRDTMPPLIALLDSFVPNGLTDLCLYFMYEFKDFQVEEMVMKTDRNDVHLLIQVCRHIPQPEKNALIELVNRLSLRDIIILLKRCNEPFGKGCALCRTRRLHALEQRMLYGQIPDGTIHMPGAMPLYAKAQEWSADDEKGFTFHADTAEIFWYKQPVDLIQICDKCLLDVNQAITNNGRFEEIYHIDATPRKGLLRDMRNHEASLAEVIYKISHERNYRRGREWVLRVLECQRFGLKREEDERKRLAAEEEKKRLALLKAQQHQALVDEAVSVDQKWLTFDRDAEFKRLDVRQLYTETKQRFEYELPHDRAPKDRVHGKAWELAPISASGKPLLPEGAAQIFGTYKPPVVNHDPELAAWKAHVNLSHSAYLQQQEDIRKAERAAKRAELEALTLHVREREAEKAFNDEMLAKQRAIDEVNRLKKRQEDRELRKQARFEVYLEAEREHMMYEDGRAYKLRDYDWQVLHEAAEREDMYNAECEQCEYDRFWGLDLFIRIQNEEERRLRQMYQERVEYLNSMMVKTHSVKPTKKVFSFAKIGTLQEDVVYTDEQLRREAVIKKLRAEEIRSKLKIRIPFSNQVAK